MFKDPKQIAALILTVTVCACILVPVIVSMFHVGEISPEFRAKIFDLITFLAGIVSGWLLGTSQKPPDAKP